MLPSCAGRYWRKRQPPGLSWLPSIPKREKTPDFTQQQEVIMNQARAHYGILPSQGYFIQGGPATGRAA